jgi:hypothetical protein
VNSEFSHPNRRPSVSTNRQLLLFVEVAPGAAVNVELELEQPSRSTTTPPTTLDGAPALAGGFAESPQAPTDTAITPAASATARRAAGL